MLIILFFSLVQWVLTREKKPGQKAAKALDAARKKEAVQA